METSDTVKAEIPFQIFVKTLTFGSIGLDVKASDTVDAALTKLKLRLDDLMQGSDGELIIQREGCNGLIFAGKQLEGDKTIRHYNIVKESKLVMVGGLDGGAKRKKGDDDEDGGEGKGANPNEIAPFFGDLPILESDSQNVKAAMQYDMSDVSEWINKMTLEQLKGIKEVFGKTGKGMSDQTVRQLAKYHESFQKMEAGIWGVFQFVRIQL